MEIRHYFVGRKASTCLMALLCLTARPMSAAQADDTATTAAAAVARAAAAAQALVPSGAFEKVHLTAGRSMVLPTKGYLQSLAEPNLIAYNGQEASFLAGGEFPVPVVQGLTNAVTVLFKEFGIRLTFTPTIAGD